MDQLVNVHVESEINPTESEEKVKLAVANVFGSMPMKVKSLRTGKLLVAEAKEPYALDKFYNLLRRERTRAAARTVFLEGVDQKAISFCLNKQVAHAGHISFSNEAAESPLGPIRVKIECENPRGLIHWLTSEI